MSKAEKLMIECESRNLHCSITYQKINDYSVTIYNGYSLDYKKVFFTDGHIRMNHAIKEARKFLKKNIK